MKTCEKCGEVFNDEYAFCPNCGTKAAVTPQEPPREVPKEVHKVVPQELPEEVSQEPLKEVPKEVSQELPRELPQGPEICSSCGAVIRRGLDVCPKCGAQTGHSKAPEPAANQASEPETYQALGGLFQPSEPAANQTSGTVPAQADNNPAAAAAAAVTKVLPKDFSANGILKNKKLVIGGILAAVVIIAIALISYTSPRDLNINAGEDIEAYFNEPEVLFTYPEGMDLSESYENDIEWTFDHPDLTKIEDGMVTVTYDKNAFNASESDSASGSGDDNTFTTTIHGKLKKGLRNWEGDAKVVVSLQEAIYFSGMTYVEPAGSKDSFLEVTASNDYSTYFYFKCTTNPDNDFSFIVDKGSDAIEFVPSGTYEIYEASGQTWYGPEILFGPSTFYSKSDETITFTSDSSWTIELGVMNGNSSSKDINSSEFPDTEAEVF